MRWLPGTPRPGRFRARAHHTHTHGPPARQLCATAVATVLAVLGPATAVHPTPRGGSADTIHADPVSPRLTWGPCPKDVDASLRCTTLKVPLDPDHPRRGTTTLAMSVAQATGTRPHRGTILVNPGGPGGGAMGLAATVARRLPREVRASYDIVGVDPRGNGHSSPIHCVDPATLRGPQPDPVPAGDVARARLLQRARQLAHACQRHAEPLLAHMGTVENAHDLDVVRAALGEHRISYIGWSYGTYLGAVYAQLYPNRIDRMILDSVVDPRPDHLWYGDNLRQDTAFQARWRDFTVWAATHDAALHLGAHPDEVDHALHRALAGVRSAPAAGTVGPAELLDATVTALYSDRSWTTLAHALAAYLHGDDQALAALHPPPTADDENSTAVYNAVECRDAPWPNDWRRWNRDATRLATDNPLLTWLNVWLNAPCLFWPHPARTPTVIDGRGLPPILLIQGTRDPATPAEGAEAMHRALPSSGVLTVRGEGNHGVLVFQDDTCVTRSAADYLLHGRLPAPHEVCQALAPPAPSGDHA